MFVLVRKISEYTDADVVLGIFCDKHTAESARIKYRAHYLEHPEIDPWKEQAYVNEHLSPEQLIIKEIEGSYVSGENVFLVSEYSEGFGQISRQIDKIVGTVEAAKKRCKEISDMKYSFPNYGLYQEIKIDKIMSDTPSEQPEVGGCR